MTIYSTASDYRNAQVAIDCELTAHYKRQELRHAEAIIHQIETARAMSMVPVGDDLESGMGGLRDALDDAILDLRASMNDIEEQVAEWEGF